MLAYLALAVRLFGLFGLWKALLWLWQFVQALFWWYQGESYGANMRAQHIDVYVTPFSGTKLQRLIESFAVGDSSGLFWLLGLHFIFWLLVGSLCWSRSAWLARLIMRGVPSN